MEIDNQVSPRLILFFRFLIIFSFLSVFISIFYAEIAIGYMSEDWQNIYSWNYDGAIFNFDEEEETDLSIFSIIIMLIVLILLGLFLYCLIGLFLFHKLARKVNLILFLISLPFYFFFGIRILLPLEYFIESLSLIASTFVLCLSYFSEIKYKFEGSSVNLA